MNTRSKLSMFIPILILALILMAVFLVLGIINGPAEAASSFRFVGWADTKSDTDILSELSDQAIQLNPAFTVYPGDLESSGFTSSGIAKWKEALNGQLTAGSASNGMFDITFPTRGNHDDSNTSGWQDYFDMGATASRVGGSNFVNMPGEADLSYSFDFSNSHFIGVDVAGGASRISSAQINWIDSDLAAAESRGLTHAFIIFHGPIYCVDGHCSCSERVCSLDSSIEDLVTVLNKHPIVTATLHGHEHTYAYVYIDETRIPPDGSFEGVTHPFHEFIIGDAGAGAKTCKENRCDFNMNKHGFTTFDVSGSSVTVTWYQLGSMTPYEVRTFTKEGAPEPTPTTPPPTATPLPETTFIDVSKNYWAYDHIETLYQDGYVSGCSADPLMYCPENEMTRGEGAVFVERGVWGGGYLPPQPSESIFTDVPLWEWFAKWATGLWNDGYTAGCGSDPLVFCPLQQHTRAEATVFFERMLHGSDYTPPDPGSQIYTDVPVGAEVVWFSKWVAAAYADGLLHNCEDFGNRGDSYFRPYDGLTRAEAACMMDVAKNGPIIEPTPTVPPPTSTPPPPTPTPPPTPVPGDGSIGLLISMDDLMSLPTSGSAWNNVKGEADSSAGTPDLSNQDQSNNVTVLAKALVFARTGQESYRTEVRRQLGMAIDTELGGRTLALGRELVAYVVAADLIDLKNYDPTFDNNQFRPWLRRTLTENLSGKTLISTHEDRPNNWGTHAGGSRAAVAVYLGDQAELERTAQVFKGWLGDRSTYADFSYGNLDWQCDPSKPVGINPKGCTKNGHPIGGVLPDDQRRAGGFSWPPPKENYVWEGMQGALAQAMILHRAGYDVWNWEDQALLRAVTWLHDQANFPAEGDDTWEPFVINHFYGTNFPTSSTSRPGKNLGWTDWLFGN